MAASSVFFPFGVNINNINDGGDAAGIVWAQSDVELDCYDHVDEKHGEFYLRLFTSEHEGGNTAQPTITRHTQGSEALRMQHVTRDPDASKVMNHAATRTRLDTGYVKRKGGEDGDGEGGATFASQSGSARTADAISDPLNININGDTGGCTTEIHTDVSQQQQPKQEGSGRVPGLRHRRNSIPGAQRESLGRDWRQGAYTDWPGLGCCRSYGYTRYEQSSSDMMPCSRISVESSAEWSESVLEAISAVWCSPTSFGSVS
jgi:hypothetical protein